MADYIVNLKDSGAINANRFGAKAANQAMLGHAGLPIPKGFCLDAAAYRRQLEFIGLLDLAGQIDGLSGEEQRQSVSKLRLGLFDSPIAPDIEQPLLIAWRELCEASGSKTVVRSSSLSEDLADSTFAGQYETFLGLNNEAEFLTAVRACWAALWSPRALRYMESRNLDTLDMAMGLCIQELVGGLVSGGGMSQMADGTMSLSASWGLGTAIAQGEVVPDRYVLDVDGTVIETVVGRTVHGKNCAHHSISSPPVDQEKALQPCLSKDQVSELGQLLSRAEEYMGFAVEIEWTGNEKRQWLLQARPLQMEAQRSITPDPGPRKTGVRGQPSGVGWANGKACVINCECELSRVAHGDVLVTRVASPSLSQILPRVSGVVAELGGSTSHLASLARERRIPMVLGVLEATMRIPDGADVSVDGVIGTVNWR
jgi:pyruvate,water dikinase